MKGYGQFCPIAKASELVSERWTILIIRELGAGSETFNVIEAASPDETEHQMKPVTCSAI